MPKLYNEGDSERILAPAQAVRKSEPYRTPWRRDYGRLVHSPAFRRLQGKTQLFPGGESDFFRNRLTHSLEVAQIAKSIAIRLNARNKYFRANNINTDIVETAALAHDLGHPPFGHNGEHALDLCMREDGGFEGNAQTLRILTRLEKRQTLAGGPPIVEGGDNRAGLNLTFRTLAAILKYDRVIPKHHNDRPKRDDICKGYYLSEQRLVDEIKNRIPHKPGTPFRTIECSIMDLADDIAYSTYDLEDAFKAGFLTPVSMMGQGGPVVSQLAATVRERLDRYYPNAPAAKRTFEEKHVYQILFTVFASVYDASEEPLEYAKKFKLDMRLAAAMSADAVFTASNNAISDGYIRSGLTSELVGRFIQSVNVRVDEKYPAQSQAYLDIETFKTVEVLKNFAYYSLIMSPRLKVAEHRGQDIVVNIFRALSKDGGHMLLPDDVRALYEGMSNQSDKNRVICDFIACMTDRYALQFYSRLYGTSHESIYAPL